MQPLSRIFKTRSPFVLLITVWVLMLGASICPLYGEASKPGFIISTNEEHFKSDVLKSKQPVLVEFWAPWCGPCRIFGPLVDEMAESYGGRLKVAHINIDQNPKLARKYRVRAIPTTLLFVKGKQRQMWVGLVPKEKLKKEINRYFQAKE